MYSFPSVLETISDLDVRHVEGLLELSNRFKYREEKRFNFTKGQPLLTTLFLENSTRTKLSFATAIKRLGGLYLDFPTETSSLKKGENLEETLLTLAAQGFDICVIRSSENSVLSDFKKRPPLKLINGGDGTCQHPTQALLDVFTMRELGLEIQGKTLGIIGDIKHSRVANSLAQLVEMLGGKVVFCTPKEWEPLDNKGKTICNSLDDTIAQSDMLYSLRVQLERHDPGIQFDRAHYINEFSLEQAKLKKHNKKDMAIFHPGPVNIGVELQRDILRSKNYKGYEQVINSIYMRMAIIATMIQNTDKNIGLPIENCEPLPAN